MFKNTSLGNNKSTYLAEADLIFRHLGKGAGLVGGGVAVPWRYGITVFRYMSVKKKVQNH